MIVAFIHLIMFTLFLFMCGLGFTAFLFVYTIKRNPELAHYWVGVAKRLFGW
jgi:hypothetical protein